MNLLRSLSLAATIAGALAPAASGAQATATDSTRIIPRPVPIVTSGDLGWLALTAGVATVAQRGDASARRAAQGASAQASSTLGALADVGNGWGQPGVVLAGAALWGGGLYARNEAVAAVGLRAIEAITVSGVVTKLVKGAFGRARPRVSPTDTWDVKFGRGFDSNDFESFPSGHSTAAFAFAAAVTSEVAHRAPQHARLVGVATYTMAVGSAYARMHRDAHWLSDVTMGAGIGIVSGLTVTRWHTTRPGNRVDAILLKPALRPHIAPAPMGGTNVGISFTWP